MLRIRIDCAPDELDAHMKALGYAPNDIYRAAANTLYGPTADLLRTGPSTEATRATGLVETPEPVVDLTRPLTENEQVIHETCNAIFDATVEREMTTEEAQANAQVEEDFEKLAKQQRQRGKPSAGRARRTKDEIAEDEAADKRDAEQAARYEAGVKAEMQKPAEPAGEATRLDVNAAVKRMMDFVGVAKAPAALRALLGCAVHEIPDDQLGAAIAKIDNHIAGNYSTDTIHPLNETDSAKRLSAKDVVNGEITEDFLPPEKPAEPWAGLTVTRGDLEAAMRAYQKVEEAHFAIDGRNIYNKALGDPPSTSVDAAGRPIWKVSSVPDDMLAKAVFFWREAVKPDARAAIKSWRP